MDSNVNIFHYDWTYQFLDRISCAKAGIRAREQGFDIDYFYNEWGNPCFKTIKEEQDERDDVVCG